MTWTFVFQLIVLMGVAAGLVASVAEAFKKPGKSR